MKALSQKLLNIVDSATEVLVLVDEPRALEPVHAGGMDAQTAAGPPDRLGLPTITSALSARRCKTRSTFPATTRTATCARSTSNRLRGSTWCRCSPRTTVFLAHVIAHLPETKLKTLCRIGADNPVHRSKTLRPTTSPTFRTTSDSSGVPIA